MVGKTALAKLLDREKLYPFHLFLLAWVVHVPAWFMTLQGHSAINNAIWSQSFAKVLYDGTLLPRWLPDLNAGCGAPAFFFYFPFPYYVSSLLYRVVDARAQLTFSYILIYSLAGPAFYAWVRQWCKPNAALFSASIYLLMPYIWLDMYHRDAYTEFFAFLFMPLLLRCTYKIINGNAGFIFSFALIYALQIMSSLHATLIISILILFYSLHLSYHSGNYRRLVSMTAATLLGICLAGIYIVPISEEYKHVLAGASDVMFTGYFDYWSSLKPTVNDLALMMATYLVFFVKMPYREPKRFSLKAYFMLLVFAGYMAQNFEVYALSLITIFILFRRKNSFLFIGRLWRTHNQLFFWFCAMLTSLLMMAFVSRLVVWLLPFLTKLQFPFRFSLITAFAIPTIASYILSMEDTYACGVRRFRGGLRSGIPLLMLICATIAGTHVYFLPLYDKMVFYNVPAYPNEYLPIEASEKKWSWDVTHNEPDVVCRDKKVWSANGTIDSPDIEAWKSRYLRFTVNVRDKSEILVGQFNFPYWQAREDNGSVIAISTSPQGLISLKLSPGVHHVTVEMMRWDSERNGMILTAISLGIFLAGLLWNFVYRSRGRYNIPARRI